MKTFPMTHYEYSVTKVPGFDYFLNNLKNKFGKDYIDFTTFSNWFETEHNLGAAADKYGLNNVNLIARQIFHCWRMWACGERIYYMSRETCNLVSNTRLTIDAEFLESPFEQIYIYTDQDKITVTDITGTRPVKGLYIDLKRESDGIKYLRFIATSSIEGIDNGKDINYYATFRIPDHGYLEDIADRQILDFVGSNMVLSDIDLNKLRTLFTLCVNSLLYLGCKNIDLINFTPQNLTTALGLKKSNKKKAKLENRLSKCCQLPFIIVNPKKSNESKHGVSGGGQKLDHQVMVSGHWRGQWKGSESLGNRQREIIRIQSYIKGLGLAEGEKKTYIIK